MTACRFELLQLVSVGMYTSPLQQPRRQSHGLPGTLSPPRLERCWTPSDPPSCHEPAPAPSLLSSPPSFCCKRCQNNGIIVLVVQCSLTRQLVTISGARLPFMSPFSKSWRQRRYLCNNSTCIRYAHICMQKDSKAYERVRCLADLLAEALGEGPKGVLGGGIESAAAGAVGNTVTAHGADVDDVTVLAPPRHVLQRKGKACSPPWRMRSDNTLC